MSNFNIANEQVANSWKMLQQQWAATREQWNDAVSETFEKDILQDFDPAVREILAHLNHLDQLLTRARRELE